MIGLYEPYARLLAELPQQFTRKQALRTGVALLGYSPGYIDTTLSNLVTLGHIYRIGRGLYEKPANYTEPVPFNR